MRNYSYISSRIFNENPAAVNNDLQQIIAADALDCYQTGWEDLQLQCFTQVAKIEIQDIKRRKFHYDEYLSDIL